MYRVHDTRKMAQKIGRTKSELHKHSLSLDTEGTLCCSEEGRTHTHTHTHTYSASTCRFRQINDKMVSVK